MQRTPLALCAAVVAAVSLSSSAFAFSQEPIRGANGSGSTLVDPDTTYQKLADPAGSGGGGASSRPTFSITGPDSSSAPSRPSSFNAPGSDNNHLYWNNTTSRHVPYDRSSPQRYR